MSWQEELRRLDAELATGTISSGEHRRRREDILAEVSGAPFVPQTGAAPPPPARASAGPATPPAAEAAAEPAHPAPPHGTPPGAAPGTHDSGPGWQTTNPARAEGDLTRLPKQPANAAALLSNTRPTTAPSPADERPTELIRFPDFSRPPGDGGPGAARNGGSRRTGAAWIAISAAVFVALAAVVGGAWWLGRDGSRPAAPSTSASAPTGETVPTTVALADRLPTLPGEASPNNSTMSVARGVELGLYPEKVAEFFTAHGVTEVIARGSLDGPTGYLLLVLPTGSPAQARTVAEYLYDVTIPEKASRSDERLRTAAGTAGGTQMSGAWYASGEHAVAMLATQPPDGDHADLTERLRHTVESLTAVLPVR